MARAAASGEAPRGTSRERVQLAAAMAVIVVAGLAVYANSLRGAFVFGDLDAIVRNPSIRRLATALTPPANSTVAGRPVLNLSLALCYAVGRLDPLPYHVGNVLIHLAAALVLFGLVRRSMALPTWGPAVQRASTGTAFAAALLWVVHPLATAAVSYTIQRAESLAALFLLLTLYGVLRSATSPRPRRWRVMAVAACAAGMGTKETMAAAPLLALLFDRTFLASSFAAALRRRRGVHLGLMATWSLLAWSVASTGGRGATVTLASTTVSPLAYAMTQCEWLVRYVGLVFRPAPLVFDYGLPDAGVRILRDVAAWAPWGVALAVLAAAVVLLMRWHGAVAFPLLVAAGVLAPSSSVFPVVTEVAAEHRMYLPSAAVIVVVVAGLGAALRRPPAARLAAMGRGLVAVVAVALAVLTVLRNRDYASAEVLWRDTVAKRPHNVRAHLHLGLELERRGDLAGASRSFERAVELKADFVEGWTNLGRIWVALGQLDKGIEVYDRALAIQADFQPAIYNRGLAWMARGDAARATTDFDRAMELDPRDPDPLVGRGVLKGRGGDLAGAIADFSRAIAIAPAAADAYRNRAAAYYEMGEFRRALDDLEMAENLGARIDPRFVEALARALTGGR